MNNLKDVSIEIPKRRLTVFTGVSGSGKSSLVFGTIAAESQRLINETYSAFVQGFMPTLARPEVDVLEGLTTAIIVDQERMGANPRSTVGTATDANAMLRIVFSRLGQPHIGSPQAFSFNTATISGAGAVTFEKGGKKTREKRSFVRTGGMCPRCEGTGSVTDFDVSQLYDDSKSLNEGALTIPGYSMDGWYGRIFRGCGYFDPDKPIRKFTKAERNDLLYREPTRIKVDGINLTYEGLIPRIQKSMLSKDVEAMQPHIRAFVERVVTFTECPDCGGSRLNEAARSSKIEGINIADAGAMQISDLAEWVRSLDEPSVAPLLAALQQILRSASRRHSCFALALSEPRARETPVRRRRVRCPGPAGRRDAAARSARRAGRSLLRRQRRERCRRGRSDPTAGRADAGPGADVITLGNHVWRRPELAPYLDETDKVVRPANVSSRAPGRAVAVAEATDGTRVAVVNLLGLLFFPEVPHGPFEVVDDVVDEARAQAQVVVVDFHAEATSEKIAMARWLDGRVTAVVGTHTHVQTNDARVLPGGTAAITDVGMTGPHDSVIGVKAELAIRRMRNAMPVRFEPATDDVRIEALVVDCDDEGRAVACEAVRVAVD